MSAPIDCPFEPEQPKGAVWREEDEPYTEDDLPGTAAVMRDWAERAAYVADLERENAALRSERDALVKGQRDWRTT